MAKSPSKSGIAIAKMKAQKEADGLDDLFGAAAVKTKAEPKKQPGTVIPLPKQLDTAGALTADCQRLHDAIGEVIDAKREQDEAENKGNLAKGMLNPYVLGEYVKRTASSGVLPTTPVILVNHKGQDLTYVVADKSNQYALSEDQIAMLTEVLGADCVARITYEYRMYSFNPDVMQEIAGVVPVGLDAEQIADLPRVNQIVAKAVTGVLKECVADGTMTVEQVQGLLKAEVKTKLRKGEFAHIAQYAGADTQKIQSAIEALGSVIGRYLKP